MNWAIKFYWNLKQFQHNISLGYTQLWELSYELLLESNNSIMLFHLALLNFEKLAIKFYWYQTISFRHLTIQGRAWAGKGKEQAKCSSLMQIGWVPISSNIHRFQNKNQSHKFQNLSSWILVGWNLSQRIYGLIVYCSTSINSSCRVVTAAAAPTCCELATKG